MSAKQSGTLRLPARKENLEAFRRHALEAAANAGLSEEAVGRLELVLEEMLVNIVEYAYPRDSPDQPVIELAYAAEGPGRLVLTLRDWGRAFDPLAPDTPGLEERLQANLAAGVEERQPGGLGLVFLRRLSNAEYRREDGANVLTLRFGPEKPEREADA